MSSRSPVVLRQFMPWTLLSRNDHIKRCKSGEACYNEIRFLFTTSNRSGTDTSRSFRSLVQSPLQSHIDHHIPALRTVYILDHRRPFSGDGLTAQKHPSDKLIRSEHMSSNPPRSGLDDNQQIEAIQLAISFRDFRNAFLKFEEVRKSNPSLLKKLTPFQLTALMAAAMKNAPGVLGPKSLSYAVRCQRTLDIFQIMSENQPSRWGTIPDLAYTLMIEIYAHKGDIDSLELLLESMRRQHREILRSSNLGHLSKAYIRAASHPDSSSINHEPTGLAYFEMHLLENVVSPHPFNCIADAYALNGDEEGLTETMEALLKSGRSADAATMSIFCRFYIERGDFITARMYLDWYAINSNNNLNQASGVATPVLMYYDALISNEMGDYDRALRTISAMRDGNMKLDNSKNRVLTKGDEQNSLKKTKIREKPKYGLKILGLTACEEIVALARINNCDAAWRCFSMALREPERCYERALIALAKMVGPLSNGHDNVDSTESTQSPLRATQLATIANIRTAAALYGFMRSQSFIRIADGYAAIGDPKSVLIILGECTNMGFKLHLPIHQKVVAAFRNSKDIMGALAYIRHVQLTYDDMAFEVETYYSLLVDAMVQYGDNCKEAQAVIRAVEVNGVQNVSIEHMLLRAKKRADVLRSSNATLRLSGNNAMLVSLLD
ncbi:hypothetical protein BASA50_007081 [Batrachochytrium salamandrivorans]|uniref:Pentacotripeptide-repeat region of PRORP domain-containing protein n=1 Tax=Batrachochytrium salamandrivorans TaxID=1357716 RepID=A0ABQ8F822_9FUNG|nr:hypothetical protein BASA50_007081 [Batrachochytrium salamandrivorans]